MRVYQLTYHDRDVIVGDEIHTMRNAEAFACGICGGRLVSAWDDGWVLRCGHCGETPVRWVRRYARAMRGDGSVRPMRLAKSSVKARPALIRELGHHAQPFDSVEKGEAALAKEKKILAGIENVLELFERMEG